MRNAVLLLAFNRPHTTAQVFEAIRRAKPSRLYLAADGPRHERSGEQESCESVRRIISNVDWPCKTKFLFRDQNLGCKVAVSTAISWFFEHEEQGIILEDDCLPLPTFFQYCDELLERYRNNERVAQICGTTFLPKDDRCGASYFFSNYTDVWGWASWRRAWRHYDVAMRDWPAWRDNSEISRISNGRQLFERYWTDNFERTYRGEIDTWDYQWLFTCWRVNRISAIPAHNQIENLGFGIGATHTTNSEPAFVVAPRALDFPLVHQSIPEASAGVDALISSRRYRITWPNVLRRYVRRIPIIGDELARIKNRLLHSKQV